jgi:CubicO group peptidase (beta-lactamase class C family)
MRLLANLLYSTSVLLCLLTISAPAASSDNERLEKLSAYVKEQIDQHKLSGAVTLVAKNGKILQFEAQGLRDIDNNKPMQKDTIFRIFSMTKPVTGTALMILFDEGKFALNDPVEKYIPEFSNLQVFKSEKEDGTFETEPANHPMTIRELMSHTGGLAYAPPLGRGPITRAYGEVDMLDRDSTLKQMVGKLATIPLVQQPGSRWVYSVSVDVQGYLVEVLSGQTFDDFLEQRIFKPLGMNDTAFYVSPDKADRLSNLYRLRRDGTLTGSANGPFLKNPALFSGGGGLTSTASDYYRFAQMHLNDGELDGVRIVSKKSAALMRTNQLPEGVDSIGRGYPGNVFGIDFAIVTDATKANGLTAGSFWWWGIAGSWFWIDPVENIVFIGMIQNQNIFYTRQIHAASRSILYLNNDQ